MAFDPLASLQALLGSAPDAPAAPPQPLFAPGSRYTGFPVLNLTIPHGSVAVYLSRRFVSQPEQFATLTVYKFKEDDRLDTVAAQQLGDPELFWRLCDANRVLQPEELETLHRPILIPIPQGLAAPISANS